MKMNWRYFPSFTLEGKLILCYSVFSFLALVVILTIGLTDNEAYYWSWSLRPDLSYFDHPPLHAWSIWLSSQVLSKTNLAVRIPALLSFWSCTYLYILWARRLNIPWQVCIAFFISMPLFFIFSWNSLPDVLLFPLALLTIHLTANKKYWQGGIMLGLALLAKWHAVLITPGLIVMVATQEREMKRILKSLFFPILLAIIIQIPVIFWNIQYDWVSVKYHLLLRHKNNSSEWYEFVMRFISYWGSILAIGGVVFSYTLFKFLSQIRAKSKWDKNDIILIALSFPMLMIFFVSALKGQYRIYWTGLAIFPLSLLFLKNISSEDFTQACKLSTKAFWSFSILLVLILYFPIGHYIKPIVEKFRTYDIRFSPAGDMTGWDSWAKKEVKKHMNKNGNSLFVASDIRLASQLLWNSNLDIKNVHVLNPIKQYAIWRRPDLKSFPHLVFFGDNRRKIHKDDITKICSPIDHPSTETYLMNKIVKIIDQFECFIRTN